MRRILGLILQAQPPGKRDYAMLLIMATYGIGAGDVLGLRLDDVDWKAEVLRARRPKTGVLLELPLLPHISVRSANLCARAADPLSKSCRNRDWPKPWTCNNSPLPHVGNTTLLWQLHEDSTTSRFLWCLRSELPLVVFLDPIETDGWLVTLENNGATNAYKYGAYRGNRYKNFTNIVWLSGNDFKTWNTSSSDYNLVHQVMLGIASADASHLQPIELDYHY